MTHTSNRCGDVWLMVTIQEAVRIHPMLLKGIQHLPSGVIELPTESGVSAVTQEAINNDVANGNDSGTQGSGVTQKDKGKKTVEASSKSIARKTIKEQHDRKNNGVASVDVPQSGQIPTQSSQIQSTKNGAPGSDAEQGGLMQKLDRLFSNVIKTMSQGDSPANDSNKDMGPRN
ncbi:aspartate/glutamate/uridylate kinase [Sesbania bispinosa]|nr:aspartate/glutamate/uridylate kinase [Sesbania bispinosa]